MNFKSAIAIIPYGNFPNFRLSNMSLDALEWPLGRPERLMKGTISDMKNIDHLITYPRKSVFLFPRFNVKAQVSVVICEPYVIHKKYIHWSRFLNLRFYKILTRSEILLNKINNAVFFLNTGTFIKDINSVKISKTKLLSLIASNKKDLEGHKLRHEIVSYINHINFDADIMGRGYTSFENKEDGLAPYYFSIVIENNQESNYFTEKLVDCFLCETIPIYWGAPNIENYFDVRGMIVCKTKEDIKEAISKISIEEYNNKLKWLQANKKKAFSYLNFNTSVAKCVLETLKD